MNCNRVRGVQGNNRTASTTPWRRTCRCNTHTLARDSGRVGALLHHRGDLLRRVLTGEAAKDDQTGGQAQAGRQASKLQGEGKAKAGGYSSPSRPGDTKKLFIICLLLLRSRPAGDTPAPSIFILIESIKSASPPITHLPFWRRVSIATATNTCIAE